MSKVVFVIGAGATFNEAKEAATSDFPPLDKGFFDKYKDKLSEKHIIIVEDKTVRIY